MDENPTRVFVASLFLPYSATYQPQSEGLSFGLGDERIIHHRQRSRSINNETQKWKLTESRQFAIQPSSLGNVGLQNAVRSVPNLEHVWIGTLGTSIAELDTEELDKQLLDKKCISVYLSDKELEGHYNHFCKQVAQFSI